MTDVDVDEVVTRLESALAAPDDETALVHLRIAREKLGAADLSLAALLGRNGSAGSAAPEARALKGPGFGIDPVTEDRLLIERILALPNISAELRDELAGYREDIEAGTLSGADRRYLIALRQRLARNGAP